MRRPYLEISPAVIAIGQLNVGPPTVGTIELVGLELILPTSLSVMVSEFLCGVNYEKRNISY